MGKDRILGTNLADVSISVRWWSTVSFLDIGTIGIFVSGLHVGEKALVYREGKWIQRLGRGAKTAKVFEPVPSASVNTIHLPAHSRG